MIKSLNRQDIIRIPPLFVIIVFVLVANLAACAPPSEISRSTSIVEIRIFFKLDSRLLGPTYGGERWVSPATYGPIHSSDKTYAVEIRAEALDKDGKSLPVDFEWTPENPEMITVLQGQDGQVTMTIQNIGESHVKVTTQNSSKSLLIKAQYANNGLQVEISQEGEAG